MFMPKMASGLVIPLAEVCINQVVAKISSQYKVRTERLSP